jgi:transposase-like protein
VNAEKPTKTCPRCGSGDYSFRSRKKIPADPEKGEPETTETKYRCKKCEREWKVRFGKAYDYFDELVKRADELPSANEQVRVSFPLVRDKARSSRETNAGMTGQFGVDQLDA